jgi:hypothetical protein
MPPFGFHYFVVMRHSGSNAIRSGSFEWKPKSHQPPKATFVTRLRPFRSPGQAGRRLPDQSTTLWVESSSTSDPRLRGALPYPDMISHDGAGLSGCQTLSSITWLSEPEGANCSNLSRRRVLASERVERRLTAILAADVAGYSRLTGLDEEGTHVQLQDHLRTLVDPKITEHRGRVVRNTGDGMLAEFSSVVDEVRRALPLSIVARPHEAGLLRSWRADPLGPCLARSRNYPMLQKSAATDWCRC